MQPAVLGRDGDLAGGGTAGNRLTGHQGLAGLGVVRRRQAVLRDVDVDRVVGSVAVTGGAYALGHALAAAQSGAAYDGTGAIGLLGAAIAVATGDLHVELRGDGRFVDLHGGTACDAGPGRVGPGAAHDNAETDDSPGHHISTA